MSANVAIAVDGYVIVIASFYYYLGVIFGPLTSFQLPPPFARLGRPLLPGERLPTFSPALANAMSKSRLNSQLEVAAAAA